MEIFKIEDLSFTYPGKKKPAVENLNLSILQGEFVVICGKSGCGKTTLLRQLKPALTPYGERQGKIWYQGEELDKLSKRRQASEIGYVMQNPENQVVTDKVWHELAFGLENLGYAREVIRLRVAEMANFFGIQNWFHKKVEELSGGQKQLMNLASIMAMRPEVLILDEPTAQLDPIAAGELLGAVQKLNQELGTTIILIEHRLEDVFPMADKVLLMENGKQEYYDEPCKVGNFLKGKEMFAALPSPMQIYEKTGETGKCPLTVREGRQWMNAHFYASEGQMKVETEEKGKVILEAKELWFRYEKNLPDVLKELSLKIREKELFCILGGNGTGKSTALSVLSGIRSPYRGKILLNGKRMNARKQEMTLGNGIAMLPQDPASLFVRDTVLEDLEEIFDGRTDIGRAEQKFRLEKVVEEMHILHLLSMHPYDLSGGERQRAALAKVLLTNPKLLFLDEPTKGMDGVYKQKFSLILKNLKEQGTTIVMVSHDLEFCASYADRCALFFDGNIVTVERTKKFFAGNNFYTTAANRMARQLFPDAVTVEDVVKACMKNRIQG